MGHINKRDPVELLGDAPARDDPMVWDQIEEIKAMLEQAPER